MSPKKDYNLFNQENSHDVLFLAIKEEIRPEHKKIKAYLNHLFEKHEKLLDADFRSKFKNSCCDRISELLLAEWLSSQTTFSCSHNKVERPDFGIINKQYQNTSVSIELMTPGIGKNGHDIENNFEASMLEKDGIQYSPCYKVDPTCLQDRIKRSFKKKHENLDYAPHYSHNLIAISLANINPVLFDPGMLTHYLKWFYPTAQPIVHFDNNTKTAQFKQIDHNGTAMLSNFFLNPKFHEISGIIIIPNFWGNLIFNPELQNSNFSHESLLITPILIHNLKSSKKLPERCLENLSYEFKVTEDIPNNQLCINELGCKYWI